MTATIVQFPARKPVVFIDPVEDGGGCWGVFVQRPGQRPFQATTRFAFHDAETAARGIAQQQGADFLDDTAPDPKGAA